MLEKRIPQILPSPAGRFCVWIVKKGRSAEHKSQQELLVGHCHRDDQSTFSLGSWRNAPALLPGQRNGCSPGRGQINIAQCLKTEAELRIWLMLIFLLVAIEYFQLFQNTEAIGTESSVLTGKSLKHGLLN